MEMEGKVNCSYLENRKCFKLRNRMLILSLNIVDSWMYRVLNDTNSSLPQKHISTICIQFIQNSILLQILQIDDIINTIVCGGK